VYGGNVSTTARRISSQGLSPRVRGKHQSQYKDGGPEGSIPACTGETWCGREKPSRPRVYPRVYGGNTKAKTKTVGQKGLSPRVRGKQPKRADVQPVTGSIPACTGETTAQMLSPQPGKVYPRVYGGNGPAMTSRLDDQGLSPRVRGKLIDRAELAERLGSIPACTGETGRDAKVHSHAGVYPRVYGGNSVRTTMLHPSSGLSPRVRGKRKPPIAPARSSRSIPACTGETWIPASSWSPARVYPRVYGGNATS